MDLLINRIAGNLSGQPMRKFHYCSLQQMTVSRLLPKFLYKYFSAQNILFYYTVQRQTYLNVQFNLNVWFSLKHLNFAKSLDQVILQQGPSSTAAGYIRPALFFHSVRERLQRNMQLYSNFIKRTNTDNNNKTLGVDGY